MVGEREAGTCTLEDFNCESKEDGWLVVVRRKRCFKEMFAISW